MSTRFELPILPGNANKWLRVNPTATGYIWDDGTGPPGSGYGTIEVNTVPLVQRQILNFSSLFTGTDNVGNASSDIDIDVVALANDGTFITALTTNSTFISDIATSLLADNTFITALANNATFISTLTSNSTFLSDIANSATFISDLTTNSTFQTDVANFLIADTTFLSELANSTTFVTDLISNTTFTTDLANDTNFITELTNNATFQGDIVTIINNAGNTLTIDLATQVGTSILPLANGGTETALVDPGTDALFGWDNLDGSAAFFNIGSGLNYDHSTHTLSSSAIVNILNVTQFEDFLSTTRATNGSANVYFSEFSSADDYIPSQNSQINHQGIWRCDSGGGLLTMFQEGIPMGGIYDITFLCNLSYTGNGAEGDLHILDIGGTQDIHIRLNSGSNIIWDITDSGGTTSGTSSIPTPATNTWFTLRATFDGTTLTLYKDASMITTGTQTFTASGSVQASQNNVNNCLFIFDYAKYNYQSTR